MKKILSILATILAVMTASAASNTMNYQAVIKKADGTPAAESNIGMKFEIIDNAEKVLFEETAIVKSDEVGFVKHAIGSQSQYGISDPSIWSGNAVMLRVGIDLNGGSDYSTTITTPILSVPTAMYSSFAEVAENCPNVEEFAYKLYNDNRERINVNEERMEMLNDEVRYLNEDTKEMVYKETEKLKADMEALNHALQVNVEDLRMLLDDEINMLKAHIDVLETQIVSLKQDVEDLRNK